MENLIKKFEELKEERTKAIEKFSEGAKVLFHKISESVFKKSNNKIVSFSFTAFTPYFNDGDECIYRSDLEYASFIVLDDNCNEVELDGYYDYDLKKNSDTIVKNKQDILNGIEEFNKLVDIFSDEDIKFIFGDHVEITVSNNKLLVCGYNDHD